VVKKERKRAEARRLRRELGWSLRRIAHELNVSLSSVSLWVREVPLPSDRAPEPTPSQIVGGRSGPVDCRRCSRCERSLPLDRFSRNGDGYQWWCRECFAEYFRKRGQLHREQSREAQVRRRQRAQEFILGYLQHFSCLDCGQADPAVLEFDHVGPKRGNVSWLAVDGLSVKALRKEMAECEVVCANCHRWRTARRCGSWRLDPSRLELDPLLDRGRRRNLFHARDVMLKSGCVDCGIRDLVVLEFDHVGNKTANVMTLAQMGGSLERLTREIDECEVRCANCHRRRTRARGQLPSR
jgi:Homeodomain-like domain